MTNEELLNNIDKDLAEVQGTRKTHQQIVQILSHYKQQLEQEVKPKKESK